jgi:hypothetical protein
LRSLFPAHVRTVVAPGNHDVNFRQIGRLKTRLEVFAAMLNLDEDGRRKGSYDETDVASAVARLTGSASAPPRGYPKWHEDDAIGVSVLVLNSNRRASSSPISNALGIVGPDQLKAARTHLAERNPRNALLFVLHHHILPASSPRLSDLFLVCMDAADVLALAFECNASAIIHGHKHMPYVREVRRGGRAVRLVSLGSALYPAEGPCAKVVVGPSVMSMKVANGAIESMAFLADMESIPN